MTTDILPDSELERAVGQRLRLVIGPALQDLGIVAIDGRIRLYGEAASYVHKRQAADLAADIAGVRHVINQLRVTPL